MNTATAPTSSRPSWLILAALWGLLLVLAALRPLAVPDEGRYAEVGRWMLQSGDWLVPRLNGIPFFHKPPLLHWLQVGAMTLFGVHVWSVRLAPALSAGLMLLALYLSARTVVGELVARRAAVMLGSSLAFLVGGQYVNHDMLVGAWISVAIWCFALAFLHGDRPHAGLARLGYVACALGVMSKGLIGLALPGLVLLVWLLWTRQLRKVLYLPWFSGLALFALIAVPWFVLAQQRYPGLFEYLFGTQQFARYTGKGFNNPRPWWFYLAGMLLLLFPWAFWALAQIGRARRVAPAQDPRVVALCWCWVIAIVGFFSVPRSKLIGYILPVMPALALLAALGWQRTMAQRRSAGRVFAALAVLAAALAATLSVLAPRYTSSDLSADIAPTLACRMGPQDTLYAVGGFPYDLPFLIQARRPMVVVQDWAELRRSAGDTWTRELFEGADFDPAAGRVLQSAEVLPAARQQPGNWLVAPNSWSAMPLLQGWVPVQAGAGWSLYRSAPERPEAAEHESLPGCRDHRAEQRQR